MLQSYIGDLLRRVDADKTSMMAVFEQLQRAFPPRDVQAMKAEIRDMVKGQLFQLQQTADNDSSSGSSGRSSPASGSSSSPLLPRIHSPPQSQLQQQAAAARLSPQKRRKLAAIEELKERQSETDEEDRRSAAMDELKEPQLLPLLPPLEAPRQQKLRRQLFQQHEALHRKHRAEQQGRVSVKLERQERKETEETNSSTEDDGDGDEQHDTESSDGEEEEEEEEEEAQSGSASGGQRRGSSGSKGRRQNEPKYHTASGDDVWEVKAVHRSDVDAEGQRVYKCSWWNWSQWPQYTWIKKEEWMGEPRELQEVEAREERRRQQEAARGRKPQPASGKKRRHTSITVATSWAEDDRIVREWEEQCQRKEEKRQQRKQESEQRSEQRKQRLGKRPEKRREKKAAAAKVKKEVIAAAARLKQEGEELIGQLQEGGDKGMEEAWKQRQEQLEKAREEAREEARRRREERKRLQEEEERRVVPFVRADSRILVPWSSDDDAEVEEPEDMMPLPPSLAAPAKAQHQLQRFQKPQQSAGHPTAVPAAAASPVLAAAADAEPAVKQEEGVDAVIPAIIDLRSPEPTASLPAAPLPPAPVKDARTRRKERQQRRKRLTVFSLQQLLHGKPQPQYSDDSAADDGDSQSHPVLQCELTGSDSEREMEQWTVPRAYCVDAVLDHRKPGGESRRSREERTDAERRQRQLLQLKAGDSKKPHTDSSTRGSNRDVRQLEDGEQDDADEEAAEDGSDEEADSSNSGMEDEQSAEPVTQPQELKQNGQEDAEQEVMADGGEAEAELAASAAGATAGSASSDGRGEVQYLVRWCGYGDKQHSSWEPRSHLLTASCRPLLRDYDLNAGEETEDTIRRHKTHSHPWRGGRRKKRKRL